MLKAKDIMTREVITVTPETTIIQATSMLLERRINGLPVMDSDGRLVGIICQSDIIAQQKKVPLPSLFTLLDSWFPLSSTKNFEKDLRKIAALTVAEAMIPDPVSVHPETSLEDIASLMVERNYHTLPVVDAGRLVGVIGKEDVLHTLMPKPGSAGISA